MSKTDTTIDGIRLAHEAAKDAGRKAYQSYLERAPRDGAGAVRDACGVAFVYVHAKDRRSKSALLKAECVQKGRGFDLIVHGYPVPNQAITSQEVAAQATAEALNVGLAGLGDFYVVSRMD